MNKSEKFSAGKRIKSFSFAFNGLINLIKNEHNSRIHWVALTGAIAAGIFLKIGLVEWIVIVIVAGLVFITELFNTAIEKLADIVDPEWNRKIGEIKDYAAGAVLIAAIIAIIAGGLIFIPAIMDMRKL